MQSKKKMKEQKQKPIRSVLGSQSTQEDMMSKGRERKVFLSTPSNCCALSSRFVAPFSVE